MDEAKALETIQQKISDYRTKLEAITISNAKLDPIAITGMTHTGYYCQVTDTPKKAAEIMLRHDFPIYAILGEDAPDAMWQELADEYGLETVSAVDL